MPRLIHHMRCIAERPWPVIGLGEGVQVGTNVARTVAAVKPAHLHGTVRLRFIDMFRHKSPRLHVRHRGVPERLGDSSMWLTIKKINIIFDGHRPCGDVSRGGASEGAGDFLGFLGFPGVRSFVFNKMWSKLAKTFFCDVFQVLHRITR